MVVQNRQIHHQHGQAVLSMEKDVMHQSNVSIVIVKSSCLIFTSTINLDFISDEDDDSNYDPFAPLQFDDDTSSKFEDEETPFIINANYIRTSKAITPLHHILSF
ncbi:unnamed protein product [Vicia faba]|uniref:Uncharacterized protein n=1 Tax=Vicia faba TaxID=3906 RepID=A0AAV0YR36_VICFA|nr:unnamed protein product [Vicia faba]